MIAETIGYLDDLLWGSVLIYLLIPIGIIFTVVSRFVQFRHFGRMFSTLAGAFHHEGSHPTSFQALALSVAGRVGSGNVVGVAVAISLGGPGAIFWMWIVGLLGMATSFFECALAQLYKRQEPSGNYRGGPAVYIRHGLGRRLGKGFAGVLGGIFAVLLMITFPFAFNVVQSFAVSEAMEEAFGVERYISGLVLAGVIGVIVFGGLKRIVETAEIIVPVMAVSYILIAFYVIAANIADVPAALGMIVREAFDPQAAVTGGIVAAVIQGVKRGLFSNEAGLGSAPNVAALAYVPHPANQGIVQALSVFIDTIIICTATAMIILLADFNPVTSGIDGSVMTQTALAQHVGDWAKGFVAVALVFFAFTSIMYNYVLGENAIDFFIGERPNAFRIFQAGTLVVIVGGSLLSQSDAFGFSNVTMGILAVVNLFALILLLPDGLRILRDYDRQRRSGRAPVFDPDDYADLDIDQTAWVLEGKDVDLLARKREG